MMRRALRQPATTKTDYLVEKIRQLSKAGKTQGEIAIELRLGQGTVARWQRAHDIPHMTRWEGRMASRARA